MKVLSCKMCGEDRVVLIQAQVRNQLHEITSTYKWLCVSCLLHVLGLSMFGTSRVYDLKTAKLTVEEAKEIQNNPKLTVSHT